MKIKYTLIRELPSGKEINVDDFFDYFKNEVVFENDVEKEMWNQLTNHEDILRQWFQLDMTRNRQFRDACVWVKLNQTVTFNLDEDMQKMTPQERQESFEYLKSLKFEPESQPTTIIKM